MYSNLFSILFLTFPTQAQTQKVANPHLRCFALLDRYEREAKFRSDDKKPPVAITMQPGRTTIAMVVPLDDFRVAVVTKNGLKTASLETGKVEKEAITVDSGNGAVKTAIPQRRLLNMDYGDDLILDLPYSDVSKTLSAQNFSVREEILESPPDLPLALEKAKQELEINRNILTKQSDAFAEECRRYNIGTPAINNLTSIGNLAGALPGEKRINGLETPLELKVAREFFQKSQARVTELEKQVAEEPRVRERILSRIPEIDPKPATEEDLKSFNAVLLKQIDLFRRKRINWPAGVQESWTDSLKKECESVPWSEEQKSAFSEIFK